MNYISYSNYHLFYLRLTDKQKFGLVRLCNWCFDGILYNLRSSYVVQKTQSCNFRSVRFCHDSALFAVYWFIYFRWLVSEFCFTGCWRYCVDCMYRCHSYLLPSQRKTVYNRRRIYCTWWVHAFDWIFNGYYVWAWIYFLVRLSAYFAGNVGRLTNLPWD